MAQNTKPESSRLNLFYIIQTLDTYTDAEHPLSAADITERINSDFSFTTKSDAAAVISVDTVKRTLDELLDKVFTGTMDIAEKMQQYGYYIFCVMKEDERYVSYRQIEGKQSPKKYYYLENDFTLAELLTLKDAVETYSYFSEEDITDIVRKLVRIRPGSFPKKKYIDVAGEDRDENSLLLMNIDILNEIIMHGKCARITYCYYNYEKELVPRRNYPRVVEPLKMMWSNGYYYLLAYSRKHDNIVNYRIDRITDVEEVDEKCIRTLCDFNQVQYRHEHPIMYAGDVKRIVFLYRDTGSNYPINGIVDTFGKNIRISTPDEETYLKYLGHPVEYFEQQGVKWLRVSVDAAVDGVELWVTQHCSDCIVISPKEVVDNVKERLLQGLSYYTTE